MFMRENALGLTISRGGDVCRRQWLGAGGKSLSHTGMIRRTPEAGESLHGPSLARDPMHKPVVREDWKSLLCALEWGSRINP